MANFCQHCGSALNVNDKFCCVCGQPVVVQSYPSTPYQNQQPVQYESNTPPTPTQMPYPSGQPEPVYNSGQYNGYATAQSMQGPNNYPSIPQFPPINDSVDQQIYEIIKNAGWLDKEQFDSELIAFTINGEMFSYPLVCENKSDQYFALMMVVGKLKYKELQNNLGIIQDLNSMFYTSKAVISDLDNNYCGITMMYSVNRVLISDLGEAMDCAFKDMHEFQEQIRKNLKIKPIQ